jgi:hypothetical protein
MGTTQRQVPALGRRQSMALDDIPGLRDRFWSKIDRANAGGCWLWTAYRDKDGYGHFGVSRGGRARTYRAHQIAYVLAYGPDPRGLFVAHTCGNPPCVRPSHLALVQPALQRRDAGQRGREAIRNDLSVMPRGSRNPNAKLTEEVVAELRRRYAAGGVSFGSLGREYDISGYAVSQAIRAESWKHVPTDEPSAAEPQSVEAPIS